MASAPLDEPPDQLVTFLTERDEPCPGCGYNLRGLTTDRCPECHQRLALRVGLAEPRLGVFIGGVVGLACGWGFGAATLAMGAVFRAPARDLVPPLACVVVNGAVIALWVRRRRLVSGLAAPRGALLAAACWALSAAFVVWFLNWVR
jgi:hypothetical protein